MAIAPLLAQTTARRGYIAGFGEATVSVRPDLAKVNLGVLTQAPSANEAATKNADQTSALITALRAVLGANADVRTVSYSVNPTYTYPAGGQATLTGFQASNMVQATMTDLGVIGRVIDVGVQAGANRIDGIQFGLKDDEPVRAQALRAAAQKAKAKVETIASGLGVRTGAILAADEGYQLSRVATASASLTAAAATPVESGTYDVRATVTLQVEVVQ